MKVLQQVDLLKEKKSLDMRSKLNQSDLIDELLLPSWKSYNLYLTPFIPFDLATNSEYNGFTKVNHLSLHVVTNE